MYQLHDQCMSFPISLLLLLVVLLLLFIIYYYYYLFNKAADVPHHPGQKLDSESLGAIHHDVLGGLRGCYLVGLLGLSNLLLYSRNLKRLLTLFPSLTQHVDMLCDKLMALVMSTTTHPGYAGCCTAIVNIIPKYGLSDVPELWRRKCLWRRAAGSVSSVWPWLPSCPSTSSMRLNLARWGWGLTRHGGDKDCWQGGHLPSELILGFFCFKFDFTPSLPRLQVGQPKVWFIDANPPPPSLPQPLFCLHSASKLNRRTSWHTPRLSWPTHTSRFTATPGSWLLLFWGEMITYLLWVFFFAFLSYFLTCSAEGYDPNEVYDGETMPMHVVDDALARLKVPPGYYVLFLYSWNPLPPPHPQILMAKMPAASVSHLYLAAFPALMKVKHSLTWGGGGMIWRSGIGLYLCVCAYLFFSHKYHMYYTLNQFPMWR